MNIEHTSLDSRLGSDLTQRSVPLTDNDRDQGNESRDLSRSSDSTTDRAKNFTLVEEYTANHQSETITRSVPFLSCRLDDNEKELTHQLTQAMFQVTTAQEQNDSFKTYMRSLEFLNVVLVPLRRELYSSVLIQDLPQDTILPLGRMKTTLNSEMTLYGIGRAAGLKKRNGDEVRDFAPLNGIPAPNVLRADNLIPDPENTEYTALFCHRNDQKKSIVMAEVDEVVHALPETTKQILREPRFKTSTPALPTTWSQPCAAFTIKNEKQQLATASHNVKALDPEAEQALFDLNALLNSKKVGKEITLKPGDALIYNNHRMLHGSESHQALSRMWLQSLLLIKAQNSTATNTHLRSI